MLKKLVAEFRTKQEQGRLRGDALGAVLELMQVVVANQREMAAAYGPIVQRVAFLRAQAMDARDQARRIRPTLQNVGR